MLLLPLASFIAATIATGYFTNPAGADGALSVFTGDTIDISWTNISTYDILSLGYYSGSNQTITWLISNSNSHPTSYRWTVDAVQAGFNLADSHLFTFYICKGYNFGDPFISSSFLINDDSTSSTSSATPSTATSEISSSVIATSTASGLALITPTNAPSGTDTASPAATGTDAASSAATGITTTESSGLSTGAKAGIAVGVVVGVVGLAALGASIFLLRRRQKTAIHSGVIQEKFGSEIPSTPSQNTTGHAAQGYYGQEAKYQPNQAVHEAAGRPLVPPVEMGVSREGDAGGRAELPAGH